MDAVGVRPGAERVLVQVDSGAVPVGQLVRPARNVNDKTQELTLVRRLPKGRRPKAKREVRVAIAWQPGTVDNKVVDLHVAPLKHPEFTGERMYTAALEAGMGDNTHVHDCGDRRAFSRQASACPSTYGREGGPLNLDHTPSPGAIGRSAHAPLRSAA